MNTDELDYVLPERLIAQRPAEPRDAARLLVVDRESGEFHADTFANVPAYLRPGDCIVLNDTRVIRARLLGRKPSGGRVELFLLRESAPSTWEALVKPSAKVRPGTHVDIGGIACVVEDVLPGGKRQVHFETPDVLTVLADVGAVPLPPYIHREKPDAADLTRYQTVFAKRDGAVAAPTAGLHYTPEMLEALSKAGVAQIHVTLHVGYGTFKPIKADRLDEHTVDPEDFDVSDSAAQTLNEVRANGGRVIAVGTTATRVLETIHRGDRYQAITGTTDRYIYPPYTFRGVDALQTNFHLPRSSLLALVYAFGGVELMRRAYAFAVQEEFRFYSYGDTMLIL
jgi:S-adenosylmethionine:tRNA ribosyltransferase-isomerase